jgi:pimeloyl-ACP methyl ester carboxylesterase
LTTFKIFMSEPDDLVAQQHGISLQERDKILALPGGPGFDHLYLVPALNRLAKGRTVSFLEPGAQEARGHPLTFEAVCREAAGAISDLASGGQLTVFAHSFGAAVLLGAPAMVPQVAVGGLLVCPVPTRRTGFDQVRQKLLIRIPIEILARLPAQGMLDASLIEAIVPYYVSPQARARPTDLAMNMTVYNAVYASLGGYDVSRSLGQIAGCRAIVGSA